MDLYELAPSRASLTRWQSPAIVKYAAAARFVGNTGRNSVAKKSIFLTIPLGCPGSRGRDTRLYTAGWEVHERSSE